MTGFAFLRRGGDGGGSRAGKAKASGVRRGRFVGWLNALFMHSRIHSLIQRRRKIALLSGPRRRLACAFRCTPLQATTFTPAAEELAKKHGVSPDKLRCVEAFAVSQQQQPSSLRGREGSLCSSCWVTRSEDRASRGVLLWKTSSATSDNRPASPKRSFPSATSRRREPRRKRLRMRSCRSCQRGR